MVQARAPRTTAGRNSSMTIIRSEGFRPAPPSHSPRGCVCFAGEMRVHFEHTWPLLPMLTKVFCDPAGGSTQGKGLGVAAVERWVQEAVRGGVVERFEARVHADASPRYGLVVVKLTPFVHHLG